jgi:hypothetical protein
MSTTPPPNPPADATASTESSNVATETSAVNDTPEPPTVQSVLHQSISRANLETEVGQVLGTFNSWWGGVKKQVSDFSSTVLRVVCVCDIHHQG